MMKNKYIVLLIMMLLLVIIGCDKNNDQNQKTEVTYTITYNTGGGSSVDSQTVKEGEKAVKPNNPTKEGFVFVDWFNGESTTNMSRLHHCSINCSPLHYLPRVFS